MYGKRELTALGATLLASLAIGAVSVSPVSAAPAPADTASASQGATRSAVAPNSDEYWRGYRDGYRAAGQDCASARANALRSAATPFGMTRMSDYDRGWLDGYDDGYARFCRVPPR
ncbi:hypothetical protein AB0D67_10610 [Streptosporangium sp. NPDC048047]|uniref:hypothetical protein n=1 Tax=Streptosporangium sp. NPDC048047 TaxID=3155748 RepID=UPI003434B9A7